MSSELWTSSTSGVDSIETGTCSRQLVTSAVAKLKLFIVKIIGDAGTDDWKGVDGDG